MEKFGSFSVSPKEAADNSSYGISRYTDTIKIALLRTSIWCVTVLWNVEMGLYNSRGYAPHLEEHKAVLVKLVR
jgi:hypothetical protein